MKINYEDIMKITFAGACGLIGFILTYWSLGYLLDPLEDFIEKKLKGGD